jgi:hypothetical protein
MGDDSPGATDSTGDDAGANDATTPDTSAADASDSMPPDTGAADTGSPDTGIGAPDTGAADTGSPDAGAPSVCASGGARVFVTSALFTGDLGGIAGADQSCNTAATGAGIGGTWNAFLSDSNTSAINRIYKVNGGRGYVLVNGIMIAPDWSTLVSKITPLRHPIDTTEIGTTATGSIEVWTGTDLAGGSPPGYCTAPGHTSWTSFAPDAGTPFVGLTNATGPTWTNAWEQFCDHTNVRLYCFERCP